VFHVDRHWCCMCLHTQASMLEVRFALHYSHWCCMCLHTQASTLEVSMNGKFKVSSLQPSCLITVAIPMQQRWLERRN
jgi:hypothetical protein